MTLIFQLLPKNWLCYLMFIYTAKYLNPVNSSLTALTASTDLRCWNKNMTLTVKNLGGREGEREGGSSVSESLNSAAADFL